VVGEDDEALCLSRCGFKLLESSNSLSGFIAFGTLRGVPDHSQKA
jgi:hypothetical protein